MNNPRAILLFALIPWCLVCTHCVIPPHLEDEFDAGGNRRPQVRWEVTMPKIGDLILNQSNNPQSPQSKAFNVGLEDPDSRQPLYVRLFLDGNYQSYVYDTEVAPKEGLRGCAFELRGLCDQMVNFVLGRHMLELYVSDETFVTEGEDLRVISFGGQRDNITWQLSCLPRLNIGDGGI